MQSRAAFVVVSSIITPRYPYRWKERWKMRDGRWEMRRSTCISRVDHLGGWLGGCSAGVFGGRGGHAASRGTRQAGSWTPPGPVTLVTLITLGELQSVQPGSEGLVGAWGCSSAGRGDRGEISRGQKRFAGAGSAEVEAAHGRRAPICGFQDPWAFRCRGQPSQRGRAPLGELGGSRLTHVGKREENKHKCLCSTGQGRAGQDRTGQGSNMPTKGLR